MGLCWCVKCAMLPAWTTYVPLAGFGFKIGLGPEDQDHPPHTLYTVYTYVHNKEEGILQGLQSHAQVYCRYWKYEWVTKVIGKGEKCVLIENLQDLKHTIFTASSIFHNSVCSKILLKSSEIVFKLEPSNITLLLRTSWNFWCEHHVSCACMRVCVTILFLTFLIIRTMDYTWDCSQFMFYPSHYSVEKQQPHGGPSTNIEIAFIIANSELSSTINDVWKRCMYALFV